MKNPPTSDDFRNKIEELLATAHKSNLNSITLTSGKIHRLVGGYPGKNHRMPICCKTMREMMKPGDLIVNEPSRRQGANLEIKYLLPRGDATMLAKTGDGADKLIEFRNILINELQNYAQGFDKAILTIGSGAFGISVAFIKDLAPNPIKDTLWILFLGWGLFSISLASIMASMLFAISSRRSLIKHIDRAIETDEMPLAWPSSNKAYVLSVVSCIALGLGIFLYFIFLWSNLNYGQ